MYPELSAEVLSQKGHPEPTRYLLFPILLEVKEACFDRSLGMLDDPTTYYERRGEELPPGLVALIHQNEKKSAQAEEARQLLIGVLTETRSLQRLIS